MTSSLAKAEGRSKASKASTLAAKSREMLEPNALDLSGDAARKDPVNPRWAKVR